MKHRFLRSVLIGGIALTLGACGTAAATGSTQSAPAAQSASAPQDAGSADTAQAPAQQGDQASAPAQQGDQASAPSDTQAAKNGGPGGRGGPGGQGMMGTVGKVTAVSGSSITIEDQQQQSVTVTVSDTTKISKQASVALADIATGKQVSASGTLDGTTLTATQVRIMSDAMPSGTAEAGNGPRGGGQGDMPQPNGTAEAGNGPRGGGQGGPGGGQGDMPQPNGTAEAGNGPQDRVMGTVASVSSDSITVTTMDNQTITIKLASDGVATQQVDGSLSDITTGTSIMASGQRTDTTVAAERIEIMATK